MALAAQIGKCANKTEMYINTVHFIAKLCFSTVQNSSFFILIITTITTV